MGRTAFQKRNSIFSGGRRVPQKYGNRQQVGSNGPMVFTPNRLPDGWQQTRLKIPTKLISCLEANCEIFIHDRIDPLTHKIISAGTLPCGMVHRVWDGRPPLYGIQYGGENEVHYVSENEFVDKLVAGMELGFQLIKNGDLQE